MPQSDRKKNEKTINERNKRKKVPKKIKLILRHITRFYISFQSTKPVTLLSRLNRSVPATREVARGLEYDLTDGLKGI